MKHILLFSAVAALSLAACSNDSGSPETSKTPASGTYNNTDRTMDTTRTGRDSTDRMPSDTGTVRGNNGQR
jgi:hypothetical protein